MSKPRTDFIAERSHIRDYSKWPVNVIYGLNSFGFFQAINCFVATGIDTVAYLIPWGVTFNGNNYIENSMRLTRYRNYHIGLL